MRRKYKSVGDGLRAKKDIGGSSPNVYGCIVDEKKICERDLIWCNIYF